MAMKKSPRAPSMPLEEAIAKATKVYEKERRHAAPTEVVAQDIGYKSANNGAALAALASLRYFGLLERPKEGHLAVTKDLESYLYAPDFDLKSSILKKWIKTPPVFAEIIDKYGNGLPSDATLRFDLINQGFTPPAAESVISVFKKSADFAGLYDPSQTASPSTSGPGEVNGEAETEVRGSERPQSVVVAAPQPAVSAALQSAVAAAPQFDDESDRIPIRLHSGRRAWLIIPTPFYEADKQRIKAHIDLLLTEDE